MVGQRADKLVVIPASMENIDRHTYDMLKKYLSSAGKVLCFRPQVIRVDGAESDEIAHLQKKYKDQWIIADNLDDPTCKELLSINEFSINESTQSGELYHQRRILQDGQLLFFVNSDEHSKSNAKIIASGKNVIKMDLENGRTNIISSTHEDGQLSFDIQFEPVGSALYFISSEKEYEPKLLANKSNWVKVPCNNEIIVNPESDNILVLNYLDLKTPKTEMKDTYFMDALVSLYKENGIEFGNPWQHKIQYKKDYLKLDQFTENSGFNVDYYFHLEEGIDLSALSEIKTVVERPELWTVNINGNRVEKEDGKFWIDKDFPVFKIGKDLKAGKNTVSLMAKRMSIFAELMPIYLVGDFQVKPKDVGFEISNGGLHDLGSWKDAGYIFYSQKVAYTQKFNLKKGDSKFQIKLNKWNGTIAEVLVNNQEAGSIAWSPEELDVTNLIMDGENEITIKIVGSLKNTFGQFYDKKLSWIYGPHGWNNAPDHQPAFKKYHLKDYGLIEPFDLMTTTK